MKLDYAYFSNIGPRRKNEDYIAVREFPEQDRWLFVLCDGMGGHYLGDIASELVAEHICRYWTEHPDEPDSAHKIHKASEETMAALNARSKVEMGTTMAMVAVEGNNALLAHCGDSRIYVARQHEIIYQSRDHVGKTPEGWQIITDSFFTQHPKYQPEVHELELEAGDVILICSDGVWGNGKSEKLHERLTDNPSPLKIEEIAANPEHDNYSAILITINEL